MDYDNGLSPSNLGHDSYCHPFTRNVRKIIYSKFPQALKEKFQLISGMSSPRH